jgi:hypothetical protein
VPLYLPHAAPARDGLARRRSLVPAPWKNYLGGDIGPSRASRLRGGNRANQFARLNPTIARRSFRSRNTDFGQACVQWAPSTPAALLIRDAPLSAVRSPSQLWVLAELGPLADSKQATRVGPERMPRSLPPGKARKPQHSISSQHDITPTRCRMHPPKVWGRQRKTRRLGRVSGFRTGARSALDFPSTVICSLWSCGRHS